jgi:hypothetical protein
MEGDQYLHQAGAALALARAARHFKDDKAAVLARQALLTLLLDTSTEATAPDVRFTTLPSTLVNRLAAGGLLDLAIHELPAPGKDLLDKSVQLCNYLRRQQRANGALTTVDPAKDSRGAEAEWSHPVSGAALAALVRGSSLDGAWKMDALRRARTFYSEWWRAHKNMETIPWQTTAWTNAYLITKERAWADAVFEMNDWLCALQYQELNPRRPLWLGGFKSWRDGRENAVPPDISASYYVHSLTNACRLARQTGDLQRFQRYRQAAERSVQFLGTLQYTDANTQHFADWYRPALVGAFHASHQDGDLRLDYTAAAVAGLTVYLEYLAE